MAADPDPSPVIIITGPTSSGKGLVAFEVARRLEGEIIALDSMKVYREMDIGTAKPPPERRAQVPHHLLDIRDPSEDFSVAEYLPLLEAKLKDLAARGKVAVVAGGTALYLKGYLDGFRPGPSADWELRRRLVAEAATSGPEALHERLRASDPVAAGKIHPRDLKRVVRALEVHAKTGRALSEEWRWQAPVQPAREARAFALEWSREALHQRIARRVAAMVERGLLDEARRLARRQPPLSRTASQSIGYKEVWEGDAEGLSEKDIVLRIEQGTRRLAKSQLTWFRKMPIDWICAAEATTAASLAETILERSSG